MQEKRPLGVPCVADRALQRSTAQVLSAIYEQDFLSCSFGGRPGRGAHQALATLHEVIAGRKVEWVLEAGLKNFFGSLSHEWMLRFVEHRVGDRRLISLIRRWLKASILEDGELHANEEGTPQGGSISVLLGNVYLHYVLDLWFERVVKPRLRGEGYLVRYIDDFVLCFQFRADALRVQKALCQRLGKFGLTLESSKTKRGLCRPKGGVVRPERKTSSSPRRVGRPAPAAERVRQLGFQSSPSLALLKAVALAAHIQDVHVVVSRSSSAPVSRLGFSLDIKSVVRGESGPNRFPKCISPPRGFGSATLRSSGAPGP
jgi:hypothetical protein